MSASEICDSFGLSASGWICLACIVLLDLPKTGGNPGISLFDWRSHINTTVHFLLILIGEKEESHDGVIGNLIVEGLTAKVNECGEHLDVITTSRRQTMHISENGDGVSGG